MSINEAAEYSNMINAAVREYLEHMSSPPSLSELMEAIPSDTVQTLDHKFVHEHFWGPAANVEEWIIARCGNSETVLGKLADARSKEDQEKYDALFSQISGCKRDVLEAERNRVFTRSISQALENANDAFLTDELRIYRQMAASFSVEDFVGQPVEDTEMGLKLLGFGKDSALTVSGMPQNSAAWTLNDTFHIEVDDREVTSVALYFPDEKPYMRRFLGELSIEADLQSVVAILGEPWRSRGPGSYEVRTSKSDVSLFFDDETGAIRHVQFHKHWPLPEYPKLD